MRVAAGLTISWLLVRELARAATAPLHLLLYIPQRKKWRRAAMDMLSREPEPPSDAAFRGFAAHAAAHASGRLFISAGETSGEAHAVKVLRAVHEASGEPGGETSGRATWTCFGGPELQRAGATLLYPLSDHSVMGISGVLQSLPFIVKAVARFLRLLDEEPPDLVVLVDYPGLHLVLARLARRRGIPVIHYIAPQYWAWGPWRMRRYRRCVDATLTILPFETAFFRRAGITSEYVGHPLLDQMAGEPKVESPPPPPAPPTLCILPGSRRKEIVANLPGMLTVARRLRVEHRDVEVVLPHVDARREPLIRRILDEHDAGFVRFVQGEIGPVLAGARVVLAKSGTGSLEACLHRIPTVVAYQLGGRFAALFARNCLSVPWIASANLIAGRRVVPEFCFRRASGWHSVATSVTELWSDGAARTECLAGLDTVRARLGKPGASARVARWILPYCKADS